MVMICAITAIIPYLSEKPKDTDVNTPSNILTNDTVNINQLMQEPLFVVNTPALNQADFIPMTVDELCSYYGSIIEVDNSILTLQDGQIFGIYRNDNRGVYYDTNTLRFVSTDNNQRFEVTVGKSAYFFYFPAQDYSVEEDIKQSEINGVAITIFSYVNKKGENCYHTEIMSNDVAYSMTSYNLPYDTYISIISSIISTNCTADIISTVDTLHKVRGSIDSVDSTANLLTATLDNGKVLTVYLQENEADKYSVGNYVEISYIGNPITINTIWKQQLSNIAIING